MRKSDRMERDEKTAWNRRYGEGSHASLTPDPFLVSTYSEFLGKSKPGIAFDVAGGVGRHALWLAERGWKVKLVDISEVGIELARKNIAAHVSSPQTFRPSKRSRRVASQAMSSSCGIEAEVRDLRAEFDIGQEAFDLVLVFFYLQRSLFPALIAALKPGGFLIYKTYTAEQQRFAGGPSHPMHLLKSNELLYAFASLQILHYHETSHEKGVAEMAARKMG